MTPASATGARAVTDKYVPCSSFLSTPSRVRKTEPILRNPHLDLFRSDPFVVEGVERLPEFQHDVVRDIDDWSLWASWPHLVILLLIQ